MRSAVWLPLFDELADPLVAARLAADAEEAGWDAVFVWDHLRWREPVRAAVDPWIALAAISTATERVRIGPMITPLARRRPAKVARETASLDHLSAGRLILGVGLGSDRFGRELSGFGEQMDDRVRGEMLDESLDILVRAWTGEPVRHHGEHYTVDDVTFLPRPVQSPGVPIWVAGLPGAARPVRRAARYSGFFPVNLTGPEEVAEVAAKVSTLREEPTAPYDIAAAIPPGADPAPYGEAGATWWMFEVDPESLRLDAVRGMVRDGPGSPFAS